MSTAKYVIAGQSNRIDPLSIPMDIENYAPKFSDWARLINVDPDNTGGCSLRKGYLLTASLVGAHSLWSNPYNPQEAYYVEGSVLKMRSVSGVVTPLRAVTAGLRMFYIQVNDIVAYSNGADNGIIEKGVDYPTPLIMPGVYKLPMVSGRCLEWYNGRLYTGISENGAHALVCSDSLDTPGGVQSMDDRQCIVAQFDGPITMIQRVESPSAAGLYVSAGESTFYFSGSDPVVDESSAQILVDSFGAVIGSNTPCPLSLVDKGQAKGYGAFWVAGGRVCFGTPSGSVEFLDKFAVSLAHEGTGIIREEGGAAHYLFTLSGITGTGNIFIPENIDVSVN